MSAKTLKTKIQEKIDYHTRQQTSLVREFIRSNKRVDRDRVLKNLAKLEAYQEIEAEL